MKICVICEKEFSPKHHLSICCSEECRQKRDSYRKRKYYDRVVVPKLPGRKNKLSEEQKRIKRLEYNKTEKRKSYMREYRKPEERRIRERASGARWSKRNPDIEKNGHLKRNFNITLDDYNNMLALQNGTCAICKQEESKIFKKTGKRVDLAVDHCHKTGKVRGLLCWKCNASLGKFQDSIEILQNAIKYLTTSIESDTIDSQEDKNG